MILAIPFPAIDPVIFELGPFSIRWYALAYVLGIFIGWKIMRHMVKYSDKVIDKEVIDDFLVWATVGILFGGRLGYVLFYNLSYYIEAPLNIFAIWHGGMSFHGGLIGVTISSIIFCKIRKINIWQFGDWVCLVAPIGLFFGRIANFVNGELFGRTTSIPWGVIFPLGGDMPRHPSQLYEALFEGAFLFILLWILYTYKNIRNQPGTLMGVFLAYYALARSVIEFFREPDPHIGHINIINITMGQLLSIPMLLIGIFIIWQAKKRTPVS